MTREAMKQALEKIAGALPAYIDGVASREYLATIHKALAQPQQEPVVCVYKATTKKGETAHFGEYSAAKAWAGWGTVEQVPLKTLTLVQKSIQPCSACEALARAVMPDQTAHDAQRKPLTDKQILADETLRYYFGQNGGAGPVSKQGRKIVNAIEAAHGIKENT